LALKQQVLTEHSKVEHLIEQIQSYKKTIEKQVTQLKLCLSRGIAKKDFHANGQATLSFKSGDEILILERNEETIGPTTLWKGELSNESRGLFYASHILVQDSLLSPQSRALKQNHSNETSRRSSVLQIKKKYFIDFHDTSSVGFLPEKIFFQTLAILLIISVYEYIFWIIDPEHRCDEDNPFPSVCKLILELHNHQQ